MRPAHGVQTSARLTITLSPKPAFLRASKSPVMPLCVKLHPIHIQYTIGRAESGGCTKACSRSSARASADPSTSAMRDNRRFIQ